MLRDFWQVARSLIKKPTSAAVPVLTLAVGLAGGAAAFSVLDAALFQVVPTENPEEMVHVFEINRETGERFDASPANFFDWRNESSSFSAMALVSTGEFTFNRPGAFPERTRGMLVSQDFFKAFGRSAWKGRHLAEEDFQSGAASIVVSHSFWKTSLGSDENFSQLAVTLDGRRHQVVGVMPEDFNLTRLPDSVDRAGFWLPRDLDRELRTYRRSARRFTVIARLLPEVSLEQAQAELGAVAQALETEFPDANRGFRVRLEPLREALAEGSRVALLLLFGAFSFFWLVCVVNVANLMLSKSIAREGEMAVRSALGATRLALARLIFIESLQISVLAAAVAAILAPWALRAMTLFNIGAWPEVADARLDARTFLVLSLMALASSLLGGLVAVGRGWDRFESVEVLRGRGSSPTRDRKRLAEALVVAEVALATVLSAGAGLMLSSFVQINRVDMGFEPAGILTLDLKPAPGSYANPSARLDLLRQATESLGAIAGVSGAASGPLPLGSAVTFPLDNESRSEPVRVQVLPVTPSYFEILRIPLLQGRAFDSGDLESSLPVVVLSQTLADQLWPGEDPLGKTVRLADEDEPGRRVVGVVGSVRRNGPQAPPSNDLYLPQTQFRKVVSATLLLKTDETGDPALPTAVRRSLSALDGQLAADDLSWLGADVAGTWREKRAVGLLLTGLALLSVGLAVLGLYAVMSSHVSLKRAEIGVRMALGAGPSKVFGWVVSKGAGTVMPGLVLGLLLSALLSRVLIRFLFQVSPFDPVSLALVTLAVALSAMTACALPARRAARVDPVQVLRDE